MRNERLANLMQAAGYSVTRLAVEVGVDAKTVERWVTQGRTPHSRTRQRAAEVLGCSAPQLWPDLTVSAVDAGADELVGVYAQRRDVPVQLWRSLMRSATRSVEVMAYAATFLSDQVSDMGHEMRELGDAGVRVRLLYGDPACAAVARRATEEGVSGLSGRIDLVLRYVSAAMDHPNVEVRLHESTLYTSLFRFDDDLLVNPHILGSPAGDNPVLHFRLRDERLTGSWVRSFEQCWDGGEPLSSWPRRKDGR